MSADLLLERLNALGLRHVDRLRLTDNRSVMVSFSRRRVLSLHRGYVMAPDRVLKAIVRFVAPGTPRPLRAAAQHEILTFPVHQDGNGARPARRPDRPRRGDADALERLGLLFADLNERHFMGSLPSIPIRLSGRMRTRLGHVTIDDQGRATEIIISRRHLHVHGWDEAAHTLLHEMVHLWQSANGQAVDHGTAFRAKAREVGVAAAARRWLARTRRTAHHAPRTTHHSQLSDG